MKKRRILLAPLTLLFVMLVLTISAHADPHIIASADIKCDLGGKLLDTAFPEGQNAKIIREHSTLTTEGLRLNTLNTTLMYYNDQYKQLYGISDGTRMINTTREYYMMYTLELEDNYEWPDEIKARTEDTPISELKLFRAYFNELRCTDGYFRYTPALNNVKLWYRVCNDFSKAEVTITENSYTYNGSIHMPTVKSVVIDGAQLAKDNYEVKYLNSQKNQITSSYEVGTYYLQVSGIGIYEGVVEKEYKIVAPPKPPVVQQDAVLKMTPGSVKKGKKTTVKVTASSGQVVTVTAKNKNAKNKNYVKVTSGKTAKLVFTKKAVKGKYKFAVSVPATEKYKGLNTVITVKVK